MKSSDIHVFPLFISAVLSWLHTPEGSLLPATEWPPDTSFLQSISFQVQEKNSISFFRLLAQIPKMILQFESHVHLLNP